MEFDNTFTVSAPIDEVWDAMLDVERVAPCVPGASVVERTGDNAYKVAIKVKLGPVSMTYKGDVEVVESDAEARRAVMSAKAKESRGQGTADATVEMRLSEESGATRGAIHTDVAISGKAAAMGQGIIGDVSARLIDTFANNLAAMLAAPEAAAPGEAAAPTGAAAPAGEAAAPAGATAPAGAAAPGEAAAATGAEPAAAPPPPPPPAPAAEPEGLPVLSLAGGVLTQRLKDPKVLAAITAFLVLVLWRRRR